MIELQMKERLPLILISAALLVAGLMALAPGMLHQPVYTGGDAPGYLEGGRYLWTSLDVHYFRTWGYCLITGIPFAAGASIETARWWLVILNMLFHTGSALVLYGILKKITDRQRLVFWLTMAFVVSPGIWFINYATLSEPMFILVMLLGVRSLQRYIQDAEAVELIKLSGWVMFAAAIRPIYLHFSMITAGISLVWLLYKKAGLRRVWPIPVMAFLFLWLPMFRHKTQYGVFAFTNNSKYVVYHYLCSYAHSIPNSTQAVMYDSFHNVVRRLDGNPEKALHGNDVNWVRRDSFYRAAIAGTLRDKKKQLVVAYVHNVLENASTASQYIPDPDGFRAGFGFLGAVLKPLSRWQNIVFSLSAAILIMLFVLNRLRQGVVSGWQGEDVLTLYLCANLIVFTLLAGLSFWQGDRFSIVTYPLVLILASTFFRTASHRKEPGHE